MAKIAELNNKAWCDWVATRPEGIQKLCRQLPPDRLYRMKTIGQRVTIYSYSEDGTVTVDVSGEYNFALFERRVFGVNPDDLEECDVPDAREILGVIDITIN